MKKTLIFLLTSLLLIYTATAQQTKFGFTGGATFANYKAEADGDSETGDGRVGFTLGAIANIAAGKNFIIQPGVHLIQKGTQEKISESGFSYKISLNTNNIEIPVNFLYSSSGGFFAGGGPSLAFAVSGKWKYEFDGEKETEKVKFGSTEDDDMKAFDLGANILAGYQSPGGFLVMLNFNQGLSNLASGDTDDNRKLKSHYFGIRLGYLLKAKK